jgi:O-antigen/teichoic acid export membrane protein
MDAFRGVLTGCHRWDLHNSIQAGSYAITVTVMAGALLLGGGLGHLAIIYFLGTTVGECMRAAAAYRVCPELRIGMKHASWGQGKRILRFGGNNVLIGTPPFLLVQTTNVLVAGTLGAAALAVFSRPISLMRHVETFLNKFSYVLTPMVGSLQSSGQESEIRELFLRSTRYGMAMALPILLVLAIFGDVVLHIWMGPDYAQTALIVVLAAGYCLPVTQVTGLRILVGLNRHGRVGQWSVAISLFALVIGGLTLNSVGWSMVGAALLVTLPLTITYGIISPLQACKELGIPLADYIRQVFKVPVLCGCALAACLFSARWLLPHNEIAALLAGSSAGFLALSVLYWRLLLTVDHKTRIGRFIPLLSGSNSRGG